MWKLSEILHYNFIIYNNFKFSENNESINFIHKIIISPNNDTTNFYSIKLIIWVNNINSILFFSKRHTRYNYIFFNTKRS